MLVMITMIRISVNVMKKAEKSLCHLRTEVVFMKRRVGMKSTSVAVTVIEALLQMMMRRALLQKRMRNAAKMVPMRAIVVAAAGAETGAFIVTGVVTGA